MPLWPFVMLVSILLALLFLPPLIAAYVEHVAEARRAARRPVGHGDEEGHYG